MFPEIKLAIDNFFIVIFSDFFVFNSLLFITFNIKTIILIGHEPVVNKLSHDHKTMTQAIVTLLLTSPWSIICTAPHRLSWTIFYFLFARVQEVPNRCFCRCWALSSNFVFYFYRRLCRKNKSNLRDNRKTVQEVQN